MQSGGNAKFVTYSKANGLYGMEIVPKYNSAPAAEYAARLKAVATGEPYVAPAAKKAAPTMGSVSNLGGGAMPGMGSMGHQQQQSAKRPVGSHKMGGGMGSMTGGGMGNMGGRGTRNGGISSDMWAASNGNPTQMSSMSYQSGGGGGRGYGGSGAGGTGLNDVARQAQRNLGAFASTVQNSEAFGTATKAAAQAGGLLGSWLSTAATQATTLINEGANAATGVATGQNGGFSGFGSGSGTTDLRNDLRRNLASAPPAAASGSGFVGFSSDDYQRSHTNGNSGRAQTMGMSNVNSHLNPAQVPSSSTALVSAAPSATATRPRQASSNPNAGWSGFDDSGDAEPAKDAWGSWD